MISRTHRGVLVVYLLLVLSIALSVAGQLLLKYGVMQLPPFTSGSTLSFFSRAAASPLVWAGLFVYAVSAAIWLIVISRLPLSFAYPVLSTGYVAVVLLSAALFGEGLSVWKIVSVVLIAVGVGILGRTQ